jgi:hypothetical protein
LRTRASQPRAGRRVIVTTVEERAIETIIGLVRDGYNQAALAALAHLQESSHLTHGQLTPMVRQEKSRTLIETEVDP